MDDVGGTNESRTHGVASESKLDFVAGISPQYWSYVPMSVMDVLKLKLKDGINWIPSPPADAEGVSPVSKCLLLGYVVYASERRDGSMAYIIDDGTGFIDCVHWSNNKTAENIYNLPSLSGGLDDPNVDGPFAVGEPVRVYGKIECVASTSEKRAGSTTTSRTNDGDGDGDGDDNDKAFVIREIQASLVERVEDHLLFESHHWIRLSNLSPVNIHSCLNSVGPEIKSQIENRIHLPAADDTACAWRIFGMNCTCDLPYMDDLLYCHCQSKAEPIDPSCRFRDALLLKLLSMQSRLTSMLHFKYKELRENKKLRAVALEEANPNGNSENASLIDRLFLQTFRALRQDGIIYLLNSNTDEYLLITRSMVLEPFVRSLISNELRSSKPTKSNFISYDKAPKFISKVHNERLLYIKRLLIRQRKTTVAISTKFSAC